LLARGYNFAVFQSWDFTYDEQGNVLSKTENGIKTNYTYDENGFKLLSFGDQSYTYDNLGNPLNLNSTYYNANWTKVHLLTTLNASSHNVNFSYDGSGLLNKISIGGSSVYWNYIYEDGKLVRRSQNGSTHTDFLYGKEGLLGFVHNGETYLYQKNIFGDIVKITNSAGVVVAEYSYTAFGECTIVSNVNNIATINPFRYRGYLLESNSGLYYLKTRFYNPKTGRFISPDDTKYLQPNVINGLNLYAYCNNNPVMNIDPNGTWSWKKFWSKTWDIVNTIAGLLNPISTIIALGTAVVALFSGRWNDLKKDFKAGRLNLFNQSEQVALDAEVLSFYKGTTVVKTGLSMNAGFSLGGTMWLGNVNDVNLVRHEHGHSIQERILGPLFFMTNVTIPSMITYWYEYFTGDYNASRYHSMPWERVADWLGGVPSNAYEYKKNSLTWGIVENVLGVPIIPFYFLFGF